MAGNLNFLIACNSTPFYPSEMGFSLLILLFYGTNACAILNAAFQIFNAVTNNRCHLGHHTLKKSQKYLYSGKNIKTIFLQLISSNVLLH